LNGSQGGMVTGRPRSSAQDLKGGVWLPKFEWREDSYLIAREECVVTGMGVKGGQQECKRGSEQGLTRRLVHVLRKLPRMGGARQKEREKRKTPKGNGQERKTRS